MIFRTVATVISISKVNRTISPLRGAVSGISKSPKQEVRVVPMTIVIPIWWVPVVLTNRLMERIISPTVIAGGTKDVENE